jgi:hypothetical protein
MPILVTCPGCSAKLNAPDSAAGKKVRCPKSGCGTLIPVPAPAAAPAQAARPAPPPAPPSSPFEFNDDPPPRKAAKAATVDEDEDDDRPRRKRRDDEDDDDRDRDDRPRKKGARAERDDDDADDRPRKKRRDRDEDDEDDRDRRKRRGGYAKRRKKGTSAGVIVAVVIGIIVVLGGVGYGIYAMMGGSKTAPPEGWKEFTYKDDGFKAYFPKEPKVHRDSMDGMGIPGMGGNPIGPGVNFSMESMATYSCGDFNDPITINVMVVRYKGKLPPEFTDKIEEGLEKFGAAEMKQMGLEVKTVKWLGVKATELSTPENVTRMAYTDSGMYSATLMAKGRKRPPDKDVAGFFDNFVLTN